MRLLIATALFAAFLSTCGSAVVAAEARCEYEMRRFWIALACTVPLACVTLALIFAGARTGVFEQHASDHVGFDAGWHCLPGGARGVHTFCYRESAESRAP